MYDFHARKNLRNWLPITFVQVLQKWLVPLRMSFESELTQKYVHVRFLRKNQNSEVLVFPRPIKKLTPNFYQCLRNSEDDSIFHARLAIFVHIVDIPNCQKHDSGILCNFLSLFQSLTNPTFSVFLFM